MSIRLSFILGVIFFVSCSSNAPKDVLGKKKMQEVLWDLIQADVYVNQFIKKDSTKNITEENIKLQNQIFTIHKITKEDFYSSYRYYQSHPTEMVSILDSIDAKQRKQPERFEHLAPVKKL